MRYTKSAWPRSRTNCCGSRQRNRRFWSQLHGSEHEPLVLPAKIPNLLINGSSGIAVGMATNIPPHNLNEIVDACLTLLRNPEITIDELIEIVPAPDSPPPVSFTALSVSRKVRTGRGRVVMRATTHFEISTRWVAGRPSL